MIASQEMETTVEDAAKKIEDHRQMLDQVKVEVEHAVRKMDTLKLSADNMADLTELLNTKGCCPRVIQLADVDCIVDCI